jgi:tRNA threonylcarbamoyladenosine biosynthesis protein TsaB
VKILALDSSGGACSAAFWAGGRLRARRFERLERGHAERLMPMVLEVMAEAGVALAAVDLFAGTTGPGTYTGLRIGLASLRALALAAGRPMLGVTSFEAVAHGTTAAERAGRRLLVAIESKRDDLYAQLFSDRLAPAGDPLAETPSALAARFAGTALLLAGDGAPRAAAALGAVGCDLRRAAGIGLPDAAMVASLAAARASEAGFDPPHPLYLRPPDVTRPDGARGPGQAAPPRPQ